MTRSALDRDPDPKTCSYVFIPLVGQERALRHFHRAGWVTVLRKTVCNCHQNDPQSYENEPYWTFYGSISMPEPTSRPTAGQHCNESNCKAKQSYEK